MERLSAPVDQLTPLPDEKAQNLIRQVRYSPNPLTLIGNAAESAAVPVAHDLQTEEDIANQGVVDSLTNQLDQAKIGLRNKAENFKGLAVNTAEIGDDGNPLTLTQSGMKDFHQKYENLRGQVKNEQQGEALDKYYQRSSTELGGFLQGYENAQRLSGTFNEAQAKLNNKCVEAGQAYASGDGKAFSQAYAEAEQAIQQMGGLAGRTGVGERAQDRTTGMTQFHTSVVQAMLAKPGGARDANDYLKGITSGTDGNKDFSEIDPAQYDKLMNATKNVAMAQDANTFLQNLDPSLTFAQKNAAIKDRFKDDVETREEAYRQLNLDAGQQKKGQDLQDSQIGQQCYAAMLKGSSPMAVPNFSQMSPGAQFSMKQEWDAYCKRAINEPPTMAQHTAFGNWLASPEFYKYASDSSLSLDGLRAKAGTFGDYYAQKAVDEVISARQTPQKLVRNKIDDDILQQVAMDRGLISKTGKNSQEQEKQLGSLRASLKLLENATNVEWSDKQTRDLANRLCQPVQVGTGFLGGPVYQPEYRAMQEHPVPQAYQDNIVKRAQAAGVPPPDGITLYENYLRDLNNHAVDKDGNPSVKEIVKNAPQTPSAAPAPRAVPVAAARAPLSIFDWSQDSNPTVTQRGSAYLAEVRAQNEKAKNSSEAQEALGRKLAGGTR